MKKISSEAKAVLIAREKRHAFKQQFIAESPSLTYVEVSMNIPGLPKTGHQWYRVFQASIQQLKAQLRVTELVSCVDKAGYYALMSSSVKPCEVKHICCKIETCAAWGRLLDIDCIGPKGRLSRQSLGLPDRLCMVCHGPQEACLSNKTHSIEQARFAASELAKQINNSF